MVGVTSVSPTQSSSSSVPTVGSRIIERRYELGEIHQAAFETAGAAFLEAVVRRRRACLNHVGAGRRRSAVVLGDNILLTDDDAVGSVFVKLGGGRCWRHHHRHHVLLRSWSCRSRCCGTILVHVFVGHLVGRTRRDQEGRIRRRWCRWRWCHIKQGDDWIAPPPPQESWKAAVVVVVVSTIGW